MRHEWLLLSGAGGGHCAGLCNGLAIGGGAVFCIRDRSGNPFVIAKDWSGKPDPPFGSRECNEEK